MLKKLFISFSLIIILFFSSTNTLFAQENQSAQVSRPEQMEAQIVEVKEEKLTDSEGRETKSQRIIVHVTAGRLQNQQLFVDFAPSGEGARFVVGDHVYLGVAKGMNGEETYFIADYIRRTPLYLLFGLFLGLVVLVAGKRGIFSILGMGVSFLAIFFFLLPQISGGANPVLIAVLTSFFIIPITFYSSHGFNKKTTAAVIGTVIALIFTGLLSLFFVEAVKLSGFASEEAAFVKAAKGELINIKGLLLAGMLISILGVLDDITVAQANVVYQLKKASEKLRIGELYSRAMDVGKDHIASMVNTLILVYTGAALPLLLLFIDNAAPFFEVINYEVVAEEIVRTLVASMGLILAVPITTYISALMVSQRKES
jgi:uncharacterized membrane protein